MFHSIRWRIAIPYFTLILVIMAGLGIYLSQFVRKAQLAQLESELLSESRLISDFLNQSVGLLLNPEQVDQLAKNWANDIGARVTIIAPDGTVLGESDEDRTQMENHLNRPEIQQAFASGKGVSIRFSQTVGYEMMYVAVPISNGSQEIGFTRIALPLEQIDANVNRLERSISIATVTATVLAILLAFIIASYTTRPMRNLTESVKDMTLEGRQHPLIPVTKDEVGQLTRAINTMGAQMREQFSNLEKERSKLSAVLAQMTDGVLIVDREGEVQLINPTTENLFGIIRSEALGRSIIEVIRNHQIVELWRRSQSIGESQIEAIEIPTRRIFLQMVAIPLGQSLPGSTLLLFQDLTHIRHLESMRRDFISNISHELRTPLASLKALTETLQESALEDPPAARRFLSQMETEVDSLAMMVQELLELSRIESGKVPLHFQSISPGGLLNKAADRLKLQAERVGLDMKIDYSEELPAILADPPRLEQVLVNLLHNAIKFTSAGGKITISAKPYGDSILFSVEDTGIGIPSEDLPRIFERFYKTDRARSGSGTGLGLSIARHLIEAHGGRIWAESIEGKGSKFYFTVPRED
jgi:two-component system phosphate regulon sensor histidine kinase PhoR